MFGYIVPRLDLLQEEQKIRYRGFYCGLCREIGALSGRSGRLLLSHDMTFLAILLNSLMEPGEEPDYQRCGVHPVQKREMISGDAVRYAAAMNVILMDFKCEDQIRDDHSNAAMLERKLLRSSIGKLQVDYTAQYHEIQEALNALWHEEMNDSPDPDVLCNLSGKILGAAFVPVWADSFWVPSLRGLGEGLGRFIYWMDAWDDLENDRRRKHINPLIYWESQENLENFMQESLEMLIGEATAFFEVLPLEKDIDLLRNVLYSGVWQRYEAKKKRSGERRKKK